MNLSVLQVSDVETTMHLFAECFFDDPYYARMFTDPRTRSEEMKKAFQPAIAYCLNHGECLGVREGSRLIAFILCFDYKALLEKDEAAFRMIFGGDIPASAPPYHDTLHAVVQELRGRTLYCLSVAVDPAYRRQGLASGLLSYLMSKHPDCNFAGDVSNELSLEMYRRRQFAITLIDEGYYLAIHRYSDRTDAVLSDGAVNVAVPDTELLTRQHIPFRLVKDAAAVCGYDIQNAHGVPYFIQKDSAVCLAPVVQLEYPDHLLFQRFINVAQYQECVSGHFLFYALVTPYACAPLLNRELEDMLPSRQPEWSLIPDVYVSIPVQYQEIERLSGATDERASHADALLKNLDFNTYYEAGVPSRSASVDDSASFKRRIQRFYLGKLRVQVTSEITQERAQDVGEPLGAPAYVDMYISVDKESDCAVLTLYSLSSPFLLSHFMDNVIRNQLMIVEADRLVNVFDYLSDRYHVVKRGTPKIYAIIPKEKDVLSPSQIASLLAAETIYPDGEHFGRIIDSEILSLVSNEQGMAQYDRVVVYVYTNVVLQFQKHGDDPPLLRDRIQEASIMLLYIELTLLEEAAIHIVDREICRLFTEDSIADPVDFLTRVNGIYDNYSRTIDFWNIQVNYPTSQNSIKMLRSAFKIREQLEHMERNQQQLQLVFSTKCDIIDRKNSKRMDTSLAVISVLTIISALTDSHAYIETWSDLLSPAVISILQRSFFILLIVVAIYVITHLFGHRTSMRSLMRRGRKTRRRTR